MLGKEKETVERINTCLPPAIRVFSIIRFVWKSLLITSTTKNFNAKNFCDRRQYEYLLPAYALDPFKGIERVKTVAEDIKDSWSEYRDYEEYLKQKEQGLPVENPCEKKAGNQQRAKSLALAQRILEIEGSFREYTRDAQDNAFGEVLPKEQWPEYLPLALSRLRACMSLFVGTHNFHNYTVGKTAADASAQRHLLSITVSDPVRIHDELYLRVRLEGQSFMLHQIRKMIGIGVEVARGRCDLYSVSCSLSRGNMITPMAPSTGLFLDKVRSRNWHSHIACVRRVQSEACGRSREGAGFG